MNAFFRHLTVRFWMTAVMGTLTCLVLLPWWQQAVGIQWLVAPALVILTACFFAVGWGMNRLGLAFVGRQVKEAAVWERAGMMAEAEAAYHRAVALFDSFWLSPILRQRRTQWITGLLARFYLCQPTGGAHTQAMITAYLARHPQDEAVAEGWLENLLVHENHLRQEHETAACVGRALAENDRIQHLLMQFFIANGRTDFDAMQTYRRVWQTQPPLPDELVHPLARLLLNESWLNHWALQVYLQAYETGMPNALEGVAAAVYWMRPNLENRQELIQAEKIVAQIDPADVKESVRRFEPVASAPEDKSARRRTFFSTVGPAAMQVGKKLDAAGRRWGRQLGSLGRGWSQSATVRRFAAGVTLVIMVGVLMALSWQSDSPPIKKPSTPPPVKETTQVTDPFTIQVAAYLSSQEAQGFVDKLKKQKLDAFWTKATSANRTWYQVKISHFLTKAQAQRYGQDLKSKGIIDDFYVANYRPK